MVMFSDRQVVVQGEKYEIEEYKYVSVQASKPDTFTNSRCHAGQQKASLLNMKGVN